MSTTIQLSSNLTGLSPRYLVWDQDAKIWNTSTQLFEVYATANRTNYETAMTELGTASKTYTGAMDSNIPAGDYNIEIRDAAGESADLIGILNGVGWSGTDFVLLTTAGIVDGVWDEVRSSHTTVGTFGEGVVISPDGFNSVDTSEPAGVPGNFREILVFVGMQATNKRTLTESLLTTFDTTSASVIVQQAVSNDGVTETVGKVAVP